MQITSVVDILGLLAVIGFFILLPKIIDFVFKILGAVVGIGLLLLLFFVILGAVVGWFNAGHIIWK